MAGGHRTLGAVLTELRTKNGWTLKEMSQQIGIPVSTLSKVEHDRLSLTYDKLQTISKKLGIKMSELFSEEKEGSFRKAVGRRSIGYIDDAVHVETDNYDYFYLCTDLKMKSMVPVYTKINSKSLDEFGELIHHDGEEFIFVISGEIWVHTEYYEPVMLKAGQSIYIDSGMGHAYVCADGCDQALAIGVMTTPEIYAGDF